MDILFQVIYVRTGALSKAIGRLSICNITYKNNWVSEALGENHDAGRIFSLQSNVELRS